MDTSNKIRLLWVALSVFFIVIVAVVLNNYSNNLTSDDEWMISSLNTEVLDSEVEKACSQNITVKMYCHDVIDEGLLFDLRAKEVGWLGKNGKVNTNEFENFAMEVVTHYVEDDAVNRRLFSKGDRIEMVWVLFRLYHFYKDFWEKLEHEDFIIQCVHVYYTESSFEKGSKLEREKFCDALAGLMYLKSQ